MRLGGHLPSATPLATADEVGADAIQIHLSSPRTWAPPRRRDDAEALARSGRLVAVHAPYLINPASPDPVVRDRSHGLLQATLDEAARCGAGAVVVHAGSAGADGTVDEGIARWVEAWPRLATDLPLLLENTASGVASPGRHLEDVARLFDALDAVPGGPPRGACLDTAHAFAGDPSCADDPGAWAARFAEVTGGVPVAHVNGSAVPAGAGRDRHANLGDGHLPLEAIRAMLAAVRPDAALLETPGYGETRRRDLGVLAFVAEVLDRR